MASSGFNRTLNYDPETGSASDASLGTAPLSKPEREALRAESPTAIQGHAPVANLYPQLRARIAQQAGVPDEEKSGHITVV